MHLSSKSLPRPPQAETAGPFANVEQAEEAIRARLAQRLEIAYELGKLDAEIEFILASICGPNDDMKDVELYQGNLGVSRAFVDSFEPMIGQLQWLDLSNKFKGIGESRGGVSNVRWGAGGLIDDDLFLTAAHNFDPYPRGHTIPSRYSIPIPPEEIAPLMQVNFKYQVDGPATTNVNKVIRPGVPYPVLDLVEYSRGVDYAILRLGRGADGLFPGSVFGKLNVASVDAAVGDLLCVIQHPNGRPKMIEAGVLKEVKLDRLAYDDIDTGGGASGSPILSAKGEVVGIHTDGGCWAKGGFNSGVAIGVVRCVSKLL